MARYLELLGVPGVGKTTTYNFLRTHLAKNSKWILYEELYEDQNQKKGFKTYLRGLVKSRSIPRVDYNEDVLKKFIKANPELMDLFWEGFSRNRDVYGNDLRFHAVHYMSAVVQKIQHVKDISSDRLCIVDEGLIHNMNYFSPQAHNPQDGESLHKALDLIYLPEAVIYFSGKLDSIMERTLARGYRIARDHNLREQDLIKSRLESIKEKEFVIEALKAKGIPVLILNGEDSVSRNTSKIISFIERNLKEEKSS